MFISFSFHIYGFVLTILPNCNRKSSILFPWKATTNSSASNATSRYLLVIALSVLFSFNWVFVAKSSLFAKAVLSNYIGKEKSKRNHKRDINANIGKLGVKLKGCILS